MAAPITVLLMILFILLAGGLWIGLALSITGTALLAIFRDVPLYKLLPQQIWNILTTQELLALPLFVLMGEILFRTRLSQSLFSGIAPWVGFLPGRLLHVNVIGCSIFAAISGSSTATTQVVGRVSLNELTRRGYSKDIAIGSLAGAGTLGFLIPPSNFMIIYGVLADVSIIKLFTAGFIPGVLLALCFSMLIMVHTTVRRDLVPESERALSHATTEERLRGLRELGPIAFLILCVLGSMYGGIATPSESAAVGVVGALIIAALQGSLTWLALRKIGLGAVLTCSMIALILLGAFILSVSLAFLGIPAVLAAWVKDLSLSPFVLILALIALYLVLGCFLDGFSMMVMTLPLVQPLIKDAGYDEVWFGIFLVLVIEMAQITPPVGFNLFIIKGLTDDGLGYIAKVTFPYLLVIIAFTIAITAFPQMALWLPAVLAK